MKGQSKWHSLEESLFNIAVGYGVALVSQLIIFPLYGIHISFSDNIKITLWFTVISIIRTYLVRRVYNKKMLKKYKELIGSKYNG